MTKTNTRKEMKMTKRDRNFLMAGYFVGVIAGLLVPYIIK
jgi:hypothetical protein